MPKPYIFLIGDQDEEHVRSMMGAVDERARIIDSDTLGRVLETITRGGAEMAVWLGLKAHPNSAHVIAEAKLDRLTIGERIEVGSYGSDERGS